ncbi:hypothetical protein L596_021566 [Steinernema carpocapsae]|uniref:Uncharacterized protein n=1 Tax=Steinernema carpocapsae TaxID=34508 RepID=A0A4U5MJ47_STECR|nr:hypothetical protein L596_021566 [Steinernema carpocapsae]
MEITFISTNTHNATPLYLIKSSKTQIFNFFCSLHYITLQYLLIDNTTPIDPNPHQQTIITSNPESV